MYHNNYHHSYSVLPVISCISGLSSVNGSSATGKCPMVIELNFQCCVEPTTSVLFDGNILTLTGLDGDMWASQLLTLEVLDFNEHPSISLYFHTVPDSFEIRRVEVALFNCPEWGISVETIEIFNLHFSDIITRIFPVHSNRDS